MKNILNIIKDSNYSFSIFDQKLIDELENKITLKDGKPYVVCAIRDKEIVLKPEEVVRQLFAMKLLSEYGYPKQRIKFEHPIHFGREVKSADIVVFDKDRPTVEYIIVEIKKPRLQDGKNQLRSYTNATGAPIAVWTNGGQISHYNRKDPNYFEDITDIPKVDQTLADILKERFTLKDLIIKDKIPNEGKSLKTIIKEMEDEVLANAGVDVFEEVFKLIFTKLYDELQSKKDKMRVEFYLEDKLSKEDRGDYNKVKEALTKLDDSNFRVLEFRNTGQSESELKTKIQKLFNEAKAKWPGVFDEASQIQLSPSHLSVSVSSLQDIKLFNSNLQIIDEAFEYHQKAKKVNILPLVMWLICASKCSIPKRANIWWIPPLVLAALPCIQFFKSLGIYSKIPTFPKKKKKMCLKFLVLILTKKWCAWHEP